MTIRLAFAALTAAALTLIASPAASAPQIHIPAGCESVATVGMWNPCAVLDTTQVRKS